MKQAVLTTCAALGCATLLTGCLFPRYTTIKEIYPPEKPQDSMSAEEASAFISDKILNPPVGKNTFYPNDRTLGKYTTSIRLRTHNRTGLVLVEVKEGKRVSLEFYVRTQEDGEEFAAAVWRLRREYRGK